MAITKIETVTVGAGGIASIDFNSIPGTYTDLMIVLSGRGTNGSIGAELLVTFNGDTGANYAYKFLRGSGSAANSSGASPAYNAYGGYISGDGATANTFGNTLIYIPNYSGATAKSVSTDTVSENNATAAWQLMTASLWTGTSAITSISLTLYAASFKQYSSASLYGVLKGSSGGVTVS